MSEITTDSVEAELKEVVDSAESLAGVETNGQAKEEADAILGRLFAVVHKFNYLLQTQMATKINPATPTTDGSTGTLPGARTSSATLSSTGSDILNQFDSWIQTIKQAPSQIAKLLEAAQYTIGVQFPFGVSVSISFTP
ncbi:MAG: hypothetical protein ACREBS_03690 [Nitrososphaerales archaeon]